MEGPGQGRLAPQGTATTYERSLSIMGGTTRRGVWQIGPTHTAVAVMGGVELDLTEVVFSARETELRVYAVWGGVDIRVDAHTKVIVDGVGIMGGFAQSSDQGRRRARRRLARAARHRLRPDGRGQRAASGATRVSRTSVTVSGLRRGTQNPRVASAAPVTGTPSVGPESGRGEAALTPTGSTGPSQASS